MLSRAFVLTFTLFVLVAARPLSAIEYPHGQPKTLPSFRQKVGNSLVEQPLFAIMHRAGIQYYADPDNLNRILVKEGVPFHTAYLQSAYVLDKYRNKKGINYILVGTISESTKAVKTIRGWLPEAACLVVPGLRGGLVDAAKDEETKIHKKCMLVNDVFTLRGGEFRDTAVSFFDRPQGGNTTHKRGLFDIYYVYDYDANAKAYFLGNKYRIQLGLDPLPSVLLGWVPEKRLCEWNTREAVAFNKDAKSRTRPAFIFHDLEEVKLYVNANPLSVDKLVAKLNKEKRILSMEDLKDKRALAHYVPRFPILEGVTEERYVAKKHGEVRAYKVGVIGNVYGDENHPAMAADRLQELRRQVNEMISAAEVFEIMFVIDGTGSMAKWFRAAQKTVDDIMEHVRDVKTKNILLATEDRSIYEEITIVPEIRFSINFFRGSDEKERGIECNPFGRQTTATSILKKAVPTGGGKQAWLFRGMKSAVEESPFSKGTVKLIVVIGDSGNDSSDRVCTATDIADQLIAADPDFTVALMAIAVGKGREARSPFSIDMGAIANKIVDAEYRRRIGVIKDAERENLAKPGSMLEELEKLYGATISADSEEVIRTRVKDRYEKAQEEIQFKVNQLVKAYYGEADRKKPDDPDKPVDRQLALNRIIWMDQLKDAMKRNGVDEILEARGRIQLFHTGWIIEQDPDEVADDEGVVPETVTHSVLMHESELEDLSTFLAALRAMGGTGRQKMHAYKGMLEAIVGEDEREADVDEILQMHFGLKARKGLLAVPFNQLGTLDEGDPFWVKLDKYVRQTMDVTKEEAVEYKRNRDGGLAGSPWIRTPLGPKKYWWPEEVTATGLERKVWMPREFLP